MQVENGEREAVGNQVRGTRFQKYFRERRMIEEVVLSLDEVRAYRIDTENALHTTRPSNVVQVGAHVSHVCRLI